jgi:FixJ family two-component response regulator
MNARPLVAVVDDDESVRESLPDLLRAFGFDAAAYPSAEGFLAAGMAETANCLVLDVAMPGMTGPALKRELERRGRNIPIIFITAHESLADGERLIKEGAVACLFKPFDPSALIDAVRAALARS